MLTRCQLNIELAPISTFYFVKYVHIVFWSERLGFVLREIHIFVVEIKVLVVLLLPVLYGEVCMVQVEVTTGWR